MPIGEALDNVALPDWVRTVVGVVLARIEA